MNLGYQHRELIATETSNGVCRTHIVAQTLRHGLQQTVARRMAHGVVYVFEVIQVEKAYRKTAATPLRAGDGVLETGDEHTPIGEPGQLVEPRHLCQFFF